MRQLKFSTQISLLFSIISTAIITATGLTFSIVYYFRVEREVEHFLSQTADTIVRDHIVYLNNQVLYKHGPQGETISVHLRDFDVSAVIFDSNFIRIGTYGVYSTISSSGQLSGMIDKALFEQAKKKKNAIYRDTNIAPIGFFDTLTVPLISDNTFMGVLQLSKNANLLTTLLETNIRILLILIPVSIAVSWIAAYTVIHYSFSPLRTLITYMQTISAGTALKPLKANMNPGDELSLLTVTFNAMIVKIQEGMKKQKEFIANASHELKTPLARAVTTLDVLSSALENKQLSQEASTTHTVVRELLDLGKLTDSLLTLANLHNTQDQNEHYATSFSDHVNKILKILEPSIIIKKLVIIQKYQKTIFLALRPEYLDILLMNLLTNAIKYNQPGGTIWIQCQKNDRYASVQVKDSGIGIGRIVKKKIFSRFFRGIEARRHASGVGIGLTIVNDICRSNGLGVRVQKIKPSGLTVTITRIPLASLH
jgi:signal transduction histidine kinase